MIAIPPDPLAAPKAWSLKPRYSWISSSTTSSTLPSKITRICGGIFATNRFLVGFQCHTIGGDFDPLFAIIEMRRDDSIDNIDHDTYKTSRFAQHFNDDNDKQGSSTQGIWIPIRYLISMTRLLVGSVVLAVLAACAIAKPVAEPAITPAPNLLDKRATSCTFSGSSGASSASASQKSCSTIILSNVAVPSGKTLDLSSLPDDTTVRTRTLTYSEV